MFRRYGYLLLLALAVIPARAETLTLVPGWNPVGFTGQRITSLSASAGVTSVAFFDGSRYTNSAVTAEVLNAGDGGRRACYVFCTSAATLTYEAQSDGRGDYQELRTGWNLVSFPGSGELAGSNLSGGLGSSVLSVVYELSATGSQAVDLNSGGRVRPGRAYWLFASRATRLTWTPGTSPGLPSAWTERSPAVLPGLVSSSTIKTPEGARLYYFVGPEYFSRTTTDGLTFSSPVSMGVRSQAFTARGRIKEQSVIRTAAGRYVMVYEGVDSSDVSRFFLADSSDGITFTNRAGSGLDGAILEAQGAENGFISAPDLVEVGGELHLYYVADRAYTFLATSNDGGLTWTRRGATSVRAFTGNMTDPDVLRLSDGRIAMWFLHDGRGIGLNQAVILSATSTDGLVFDLGPTVVRSSPGVLKINPDVVPLSDGRYWMFFGQGLEPNYDLLRADSN